MNWYKDILHLFTKLSEQSFQNILSYGTIARALTNLVVSTIVLYVMTYALPLMVKAIAPMLGIKRMTGFAHFDMISAVANASFLIFQILIGAFVIWRLLILFGGSGTYRGVMCNYIYGLAYTNALRTVVIVFVHILGLILFAISQQKYVADIAYLVTMFSQYYAVFILCSTYATLSRSLALLRPIL